MHDSCLKRQVEHPPGWGLRAPWTGSRQATRGRIAASAPISGRPDKWQWMVSYDGPFRAHDLPGALSVPERLTLLRRLVREGVLRPAG
ncbi:hypothetical protein Cch01nite_41220 [Cellulomonas chitinilytica]|uniref:Uncharacterized protein n=1 Tax=Cellulomonas chitinilytica TaxID=398759 RepID=A0A919P7G2_9CELL|nr:hypothetical protein Cch01nite_41220 [Cellulomonas chitinilytica]